MSKRSAKAGRLLQRGGYRNRADRCSDQLNECQCRDLIGAAEKAEALGQPFNRFVTILWERGGIVSRDNAKVTGQFIKLASDWARQHGYRLNWAWVQEWGSFHRAHIHILLLVPPMFDPIFRPMPLRWTKRLLPGGYLTGVLECQKLGFLNNPLAREVEAMGKVHYMLKCAPAALELKLDMHGRGYTEWGRDGVTFGKRMGIWQGWRNACKAVKNRKLIRAPMPPAVPKPKLA